MQNNNPFIPNSGSRPNVPANNGGMPHPGPSGSRNSGDMFEIDLSRVDSGLTIPDGEYTLQCIEVEQGVSKADNPQYIWTFVIVDHPEFEGREFKVFTALTPAAMWKVAETVEALGIGSTGQTVRFGRKDVIGKKCVGDIEKQTYNNTERSQISRLRRIG